MRYEFLILSNTMLAGPILRPATFEFEMSNSASKESAVPSEDMIFFGLPVRATRSGRR